MKIALIRLSTVHGGVESHLFSLASRLKAFGHKPALVFRDRSLVNRAKGLGLETHHVKKRFKVDPPFLWNLGKKLREISPDIVHSHGILSDFCAAFILSRNPAWRTRHVITLHSLPWIGFGLGKPKTLVYKQMHAFSMRRATQVIAVSKWLGNQINVSDFNKNKIHVVYNGLDREKYDLLYRRRHDKRKKDQTGKTMIGYAGRLSKEKGVAFFVRALALLAGTPPLPPGIEGVIVGDGNERERLEELIADLRLTETVKILGFQEEVERFLAHFNIFVLPSMTEGFPMILLEAGAMGIPIVATKVGGTPELIRNGVDGLLVSPGSAEALAKAISEIARDPDLGIKMAESLRVRIQEKFTLDTMAKETLKVYRKAFQ